MSLEQIKTRADTQPQTPSRPEKPEDHGECHPAHFQWVMERERERQREGQLMHQGHRLPGQAVPLRTEELGHTSHSAGPAPEAQILVQRGEEIEEGEGRGRRGREEEWKKRWQKRGEGGREEERKAWA